MIKENALFSMGGYYTEDYFLLKMQKDQLP